MFYVCAARLDLTETFSCKREADGRKRARGGWRSASWTCSPAFPFPVRNMTVNTPRKKASGSDEWSRHHKVEIIPA